MAKGPSYFVWAPVWGCALLLLSGCTMTQKPRAAAAHTDAELEQLEQQAQAQAQSDPAYKVMSGVFISDGRRLPVPRNARLPELFGKPFALHAGPQSLRQLASALSAQVGLPVTVAAELTSQSAPAAPAAPGAGVASEEHLWPVEFDGTLVSFLDALAAHFGASWDYEGGAISVFRTRTRVFALAAAPGKLTATDSITNENKVGTAEAGGASLAGGTTAQGENTSGGYQQVELKQESDIWAQVMNDLKVQLSGVGRAQANPAAGIVTVTDTPAVLDQIADYIAAVNSRLNRQIALTVRLYALTMSIDQALGFSLDAVFSSATGLKLNFKGAQPFTPPTGIATANAVVLPAATGGLAKWVDTDLTVQALRSAGHIVQVTEMSPHHAQQPQRAGPADEHHDLYRADLIRARHQCGQYQLADSRHGGLRVLGAGHAACAG